MGEFRDWRAVGVLGAVPWVLWLHMQVSDSECPDLFISESIALPGYHRDLVADYFWRLNGLVLCVDRIVRC